MKLIKKLGRYLKGRPRLVSKFRWQEMPEMLTTFTDGGAVKTRRGRMPPTLLTMAGESRNASYRLGLPKSTVEDAVDNG